MDCVDAVEPHSPGTYRIRLVRTAFLLPASPPRGPTWHLILYCDGITPGAVLSPENRRKGLVFYGSFLQFGSLLSFEEVWISLALARTRSYAHPVPSCMSNILHVREGWSCGGDRICTCGGDRNSRSRGCNLNPDSRCGGYRAHMCPMHASRACLAYKMHAGRNGLSKSTVASLRFGRLCCWTCLKAPWS